MNYVSTRGAWHDRPQPFSAILLEGLAPDGGLAVPERYPAFATGELERLAGAPYRDIAYAVLSRFVGDIPAGDLKALIGRAYTAEKFGSDAIVPIRELEPGLALLQVSNGPTLAFKDIALQLLGELFEYALARAGRRITILGATSGDTGSSAEVAMRGRRGIDVFMLSPHGRMSPFQQAQMFSLADANIHNLAVEGTFDDCQDIVKAISADAVFKRRYAIGAVNSINWARIAAQVVYYVHGWLAARRAPDGPIDVAVPSGNFGNILAAHVAKRMGAPLRRLVLATNENDVLDEFFRTGRYRPRSAAETRATSSPSMDISKASGATRPRSGISGRGSRRTAASTSPAPTPGRRSGRPGSPRGAARTPTASRRSATSPRATASSSIPTRPTGSRSGASIATRRCRCCASRRRSRPSSRRRFARRWGAILRVPPRSTVSSRVRSTAR